MLFFLFRDFSLRNVISAIFDAGGCGQKAGAAGNAKRIAPTFSYCFLPCGHKRRRYCIRKSDDEKWEDILRTAGCNPTDYEVLQSSEKDIHIRHVFELKKDGSWISKDDDSMILNTRDVETMEFKFS